MNNKCNAEIRNFAKQKNVRFWQIAEAIGISEPTMTRKMRKELSKDEKEKIIAIIDVLAVEGDEMNANNVIN